MRIPYPALRGAAAALLTFSLILTALAIAAPASASEAVGHVTQISGNAYAETTLPDPPGESLPPSGRRPLAQEAAVFSGGVVTTGHEASVLLAIIDGTKVSLGGDGEMKIDSYVYAPANARGDGTLVVARGVFRVVSGGLAKLPNEPLHIRVGTASLGIRGTDVWGQVSGDQLMLALLDGKGMSVENMAGRSETAMVNSAIWVGGRDQAPARPSTLTWLDYRRASIPTLSGDLIKPTCLLGDGIC